MVIAGSALSGLRAFPKNAKLGEISAVEYPAIKINGAAMRTAPGLRVFDQRNLVILPTQIPEKGEIMYELEASGLVKTIWLLTPEETKELK